jgi:hypothetical protein
MKLNLKQTIAIDYLQDTKTNEGIYGGAAGGGKSVLGSYYLLKNSMKYPGSRWLMGRAKLKTLKETTLNSFLFTCHEQGLKGNIHYKINNQNNQINFYNGSVIFMKDLFYYPSDPEFDELGSLEITGAFIDECNQITEKAWNIVRSRIRYALDENELIPKMLGTCNPSKNFIYRNFYKPFRERTLRDDFFFVQAFVSDNPNISIHYVNNLDKLDPVSRERLRDGNWEYEDDPAQLIDYEKAVDLFTNNFVSSGKKYMTVDVARLGDDKTVIRTWDGLRCIDRIAFEKLRTNDVSDKIKQLQVKFSVPNLNTIVDEDGVGGGVVDLLRCKGFIGNSRPIEQPNMKHNYQNLRSQCYFMLADYINSNKIFLYDLVYRDNIVQELEQIKQKDIDKDGKLAIISKDIIKQNIGRSPDDADTLMMRMWFELNPKPFKGHKAMSK